ncbi:formate--tetrahydrofolate ligase [Gehongia tenuis]|uniref:Formate--tetrahydrofolate ligase n=1 Tax=Gehongia tenuis TaxID=2763655 RepID=A0A926D640_9FIRM|nr:formate--tetrahydrofolate ligase [Gehongia tenuis]MBC8532032.1 formate--tetrahydrofolate ligase [Gehongia tenuis]
MTDIEIANAAQPLPIGRIASGLGLTEEQYETYGRYKAKVRLETLQGRPLHGKLVLVTAISPTPAGEGKTTVSVGLGDALTALGTKAVLALREPSLGPVFGIKGGAAGGGYAQVIPMEDINLHFTGDLHAITAANNLLSAMVDNHIKQGLAPAIRPGTVTFRRCLDMNDRQLRQVVTGLGGKANGVPAESGFDITAASEVMAVLCLAKDLSDLKTRLSRIVVGENAEGGFVTAGDIGAAGAMAVLLKDAIHPNLVQTLEHTPCFMHGGPFANIAHGCNSVAATRMALALGDVVVTEAGFGADLGAEKFFDIKCRQAGLRPDCAVLVATCRALKMHGGVDKPDLDQENVPAMTRGFSNLEKHLENLRGFFGLPVVVAINRFPGDTEGELGWLTEKLAAMGVPAALCDVHQKGSKGGIALAQKVLDALRQPAHFDFAYGLEDPLGEKIETVARRIYGATKVTFSPEALRTLQRLTRLGYGSLPICIAKTQYSFTDDPKRMGWPESFEITVRQVRLSAGAGFVVALTGDMMTMPGLPKRPAALSIDMDEHGRIQGLF